METIEKGERFKSKMYRNRRLGEFLKELDLTEGRSTGIPTIQERLICWNEQKRILGVTQKIGLK